MNKVDQFLEHYQGGIEKGRLATGPGLIEFQRTQAIINRYLPKEPIVVYDVGGGPGTYAVWLLGLGHAVHLVDPVQLHVDQASAAMVHAKSDKWSATLGEARSLKISDESADVVLLLGPLYHLTARTDRIAALSEAKRILRQGGHLFAGAISRFASLLDGLARNFVDDADFRSTLERDLIDGQHRNPTGHPNYFTTAFFHHPDELRSELTESGFKVDLICGIEGPTWILPDINDRWANDTRRELWMKLIERVETEPALIGASAHLLAVGVKP